MFNKVGAILAASIFLLSGLAASIFLLSGESAKGQPRPRPVFIYVVKADGRLVWLRHNGAKFGDGLETPGAWDGPKDVGRGWGDLHHVFPGGNGIIYTIADDGILRWLKHNGFRTGAGLEDPTAWEGPKDVGRGWGDATHVFALMPVH